MEKKVNEDVLLASLAQAIGEPARSRMLLSLLDGRARTSTELAVLAEVALSTASAHLSRLKEAKLVRVAVQSRHRFYLLDSAEVAAVIEKLGALSGRETKKFIPNTPEPLRYARSCYDHMAGAVAVSLHDHFLRQRWLICDERDGAEAYQLSARGAAQLERMGVDLSQARGLRRRFAFPCLDWSERRPHLAGVLGAALLQHALSKNWVVRELDSRALRLSRAGEKNFAQSFGLSGRLVPNDDLR